jgi:hypothetical protein
MIRRRANGGAPASLRRNLQERLYRPESLLANGSGQKFIARGYDTTGADLCTMGSKKRELNLSKARSMPAPRQ